MLDKKFFIDFIKKNSHKFVFYSYHGGGGGEFICNYLTEKTDYFYNKQINVNTYIKPGENRSTFNDVLFGGAFTNLAQKGISSLNYDGQGHKFWKYSIISRWNPLYNIDFINKHIINTDGHVVEIDDEIYYNDIIEKLFNYNRDVPGIDDEIKHVCKEFTNQNKPYLIKTHGISKDFMYFKDSKFIELTIDKKWERYCDLLHTIKVVICPAITYKEKIDLINRVIFRFKIGEPHWTDYRLAKYLKELDEFDSYELKQKAIDYIGEDFLIDDEKKLYTITVYTLLAPEFYRINLNDYNIDELNAMLLLIQLHRGFIHRQETSLRELYMDIYMGEETHSSYNRLDDTFFWERHPTWTEIFNPTLLNFGELFSGEWVEKAFGIDRAAYEKAFDTWHKNNIKLLNSYGINDA